MFGHLLSTFMLLLLPGVFAPSCSLFFAGPASPGNGAPPLQGGEAREIDRLRESLYSKDEYASFAAALRLVEIASPEADELLAEALRLGETSLRVRVIEAYANSGTNNEKTAETACRLLRSRLADPDKAIREATVKALVRIEQPSVLDMLGDVLASPQGFGLPLEKQSALEILVRKAPKTVTPVLIQALRKNLATSRYETRRAILSSLKSVTGQEFYRFSDWDAWWKSNQDRPAIEWYRKKVEALETELKRRSEQALAYWQKYVQFLAKNVNQDVYLEEVRVAVREAEVQLVRLDAIARLGAQGQSRDVKILSDAFSTGPMPIKLAALQALGKLGDATTAAVILPVLDHEDRELIIAALGALGTLHAASSARPIVSVLERVGPGNNGPADQAVRIAALSALREIANYAALGENVDEDGVISKAVMGCLVQEIKGGEENAEVMKSATITLGALGRGIHPSQRQAAVTAVSLLFTHKVPELRRSAVWALGKIGDLAAVPQLLAAQKDEQVGVRQEAVEALGALALALPQGSGRDEVLGGICKVFEGSDADVAKTADSVLVKLMSETKSATDLTTLDKITDELQRYDAFATCSKLIRGLPEKVGDVPAAARESYWRLLRRQARCLGRLKTFDESLALWERLLKEFPADVDIMLGKADTLWLAGRFADADAIYRELIQKTPPRAVEIWSRRIEKLRGLIGQGNLGLLSELVEKGSALAVPPEVAGAEAKLREDMRDALNKQGAKRPAEGSPSGEATPKSP